MRKADIPHKTKAGRPSKAGSVKKASSDLSCKKAKKVSPARKKGPVEKTRAKTYKPGLRFIGAAALILFLALSLPFIIRFKSDSGAKPPKGIYKFGIDISHNNYSPIVWDSLKVLIGQDGRTVRKIKAAKTILPVSFIYIKATEGENFKDRAFKKNWEEAGKRGLSRGAYHFFRSSKDPLAQAKNFIETVGNLSYKDLPPVLDIETIHKGCSYAELNEKALLWLKAVEERYGKKPIVYTSARFASDILSKDISSSYPLWLAHYGVESPGRKDWIYWQFTDKAVVHGVPGFVDLNVMKLKEP